MTKYGYLTDAQRFIRMASVLIEEEMTDDEVVQSALLFAIGVEKLLKYILSSINPVFILSKPDFDNAALLLYKDAVIQSSGQKRAEVLDEKVVSFRVALDRAQKFSKAAVVHSQLLFSLAEWRDLIAHRESSDLNIRDVKRMLQIDAFVLLDDMCKHHSLTVAGFLGDRESSVRGLSQELTHEAVTEDARIALLNTHKQIWRLRSTNPDEIEHAKLFTQLLLLNPDISQGSDAQTCPACGNECVLRFDVDANHADAGKYPGNQYIRSLDCFYCDLVLNSYEVIDYMTLGIQNAQAFNVPKAII